MLSSHWLFIYYCVFNIRWAISLQLQTAVVLVTPMNNSVRWECEESKFSHYHKCHLYWGCWGCPHHFLWPILPPLFFKCLFSFSAKNRLQTNKWDKINVDAHCSSCCNYVLSPHAMCSLHCLKSQMLKHTLKMFFSSVHCNFSAQRRSWVLLWVRLVYMDICG